MFSPPKRLPLDTLTENYYLPTTLVAATESIGLQTAPFYPQTNLSPQAHQHISARLNWPQSFIRHINACIALLNSKQLHPSLAPFTPHFQRSENREAVEVGSASLTARHLIFRLHSIKMGDSGQLMSTMTFSSISATAAFYRNWLGNRTQSPAKLEVVYCCMTGCYNC